MANENSRDQDNGGQEKGGKARKQGENAAQAQGPSKNAGGQEDSKNRGQDEAGAPTKKAGAKDYDNQNKDSPRSGLNNGDLGTGKND